MVFYMFLLVILIYGYARILYTVSNVVEIQEISEEEFENYQNSRARSGQWKQIIQQIRKNKKPLKVSGLTKGQVAAGYRALTKAGFNVKANYKQGFLLVSP